MGWEWEINSPSSPFLCKQPPALAPNCCPLPPQAATVLPLGALVSLLLNQNIRLIRTKVSFFFFNFRILIFFITKVTVKKKLWVESFQTQNMLYFKLH